MATVSRPRPTREIKYPSGDGKPMAETDVHRDDMTDLIHSLKDYFTRARKVYVSGNLLMYYQEGDLRKHVAPDVFVVRGVKKHNRESYLVWEEGRSPDLVIEITSKSTQTQDQRKKFGIYRDNLRVPEYFLFDPTEDYLDPPLQGFRLVGGDYVTIEPIDGRLPSQVLGLHLECDGAQLRLFDPATGQRVPTLRESRDAERRHAEGERQRAEAEHQRAEAERQRAEAERQRAEAERQRAEAERQRAGAAEAAQRRDAQEMDRLRREIEALRRG